MKDQLSPPASLSAMSKQNLLHEYLMPGNSSKKPSTSYEQLKLKTNTEKSVRIDQLEAKMRIQKKYCNLWFNYGILCKTSTEEPCPQCVLCGGSAKQ